MCVTDIILDNAKEIIEEHGDLYAVYKLFNEYTLDEGDQEFVFGVLYGWYGYSLQDWFEAIENGAREEMKNNDKCIS